MGGLTALAIRLYEEFQFQPEALTNADDPNRPDSSGQGHRTPEMCAAKQFNVVAWRSHRPGDPAAQLAFVIIVSNLAIHRNLQILLCKILVLEQYELLSKKPNTLADFACFRARICPVR